MLCVGLDGLTSEYIFSFDKRQTQIFTTLSDFLRSQNNQRMQRIDLLLTYTFVVHNGVHAQGRLQFSLVHQISKKLTLLLATELKLSESNRGKDWWRTLHRHSFQGLFELIQINVLFYFHTVIDFIEHTFVIGGGGDINFGCVNEGKFRNCNRLRLPHCNHQVGIRCNLHSSSDQL